MPSAKLILPTLALLALSSACDNKVPAKKTNAPQAKASETGEKTKTEAAETKKPSSQDLTFKNGDFTLEGTLNLPAGQGPFPAVVLIHGSGPHSRDQSVPGQLAMRFSQPISVFKELGEQLSALGVAVLRYDKRTCFSKNGCSNKYPEPKEDLVIEDFSADALAALKYLSSRPDIDKNHLVIVGHSQGAGLVPQVMKAMPELYAGVAIAPPGPSFAGTLQHQIDKTLSLVPENQKPMVKAQMKGLIEDIEKLKQVEAGKEVKEPILGTPPSFMKSQVNAAKEALELAKVEKRPIWALRGSYDWNIPPQDFEAWRSALESSAHAASHQVIDLPQLSHALNRIRQSDPTKIQPQDIEPHVHPSVAETIVRLVQADSAQKSAASTNGATKTSR